MKEKDLKLLRQIAIHFVAFPQYTIEKIAAKIGVNKSTIHRIFGTKEEIMKMINEIAIFELKGVAKIIDDNTNDDFYDKFSKITLKLIDVRELIIFNIITREKFIESKEFLDGFIKSLDSLFQNGQENGIIKINISPRLMSDLYISCLNGLSYSINSGRITLIDAQNQFNDLFLKGILRN
ncbi:MAG: TetR/AcrR family transcriptional regulator [Mycoplasma sp.]